MENFGLFQKLLVLILKTPMNKLILEFEKNRKVVREPESKFCFIFKNLKKYEYVKHPNSLFYRNKKGDILAVHDLKNDIIWLQYEQLWLIFHEKYERNYDKTQSVIKSMLETHFKTDELIPKRCYNRNSRRLETHFKTDELIPTGKRIQVSWQLEKYFKTDELTPIKQKFPFENKLETHSN